MYYFELLKSLNDNKVRYLIVGGLAVNLHGIPRMTQDIDIIIEMQQDNIINTIKSFKDIGYSCKLPINPEDMAKPEIVQEWISKRNLVAISFFDCHKPFKIADIILEHPLSFEEAFKCKITKIVKDIPVNIASIDDLVKMKLKANRKQDISDIELLNKIQKMGE